MTAPVGRVVSLYIDTATDHVDEGDVIQTPSDRSYRVVASRQQQRGIHVGRWHLQALVIDADTVTDEDRVIQIVWYPRNHRRRTP
jgi:hypothetical protein